MSYKYIDMSTYKRKSHFDYFNKLAIPHVGVTVNIDITDFLKVLKKNKCPFFLSLCYCVTRAANGVKEFRQRIIDDKIIEFDQCFSTHTLALEDETYCYCKLDPNLPYFEYLPHSLKAQEEAKKRNTIKESREDKLQGFFISCVPWISYSALINPMPIPADSNPRITRGKYFEENGKLKIPISTLCNHAIVDGLHISKFYENLEREIADLTNLIKNK